LIWRGRAALTENQYGIFRLRLNNHIAAHK
jgi:hypothetical protein